MCKTLIIRISPGTGNHQDSILLAKQRLDQFLGMAIPPISGSLPDKESVKRLVAQTRTRHKKKKGTNLATKVMYIRAANGLEQIVCLGTDSSKALPY